LPSTYRPWETLLVYGIKDRSWPSPVSGKVASARELRRTAGVFVGSPNVQQHLVDNKVRTTEYYNFPGHSPMDFFST
jgi:hypothetical protein